MDSLDLRDKICKEIVAGDDQARELKAWFKKNNQHFRGYAPNEIAYLALTCGFDGPEVYDGVNEYLGRVKRLFLMWESPFLENWLRLASYDRGKDD